MSKRYRISPELAKKLGEKIGVDWNKIDPEEFRLGIEIELSLLERKGKKPSEEDLLLAANTAHNFLKETPNYYTLFDIILKEEEANKDLKESVIIED